MLGLNGNPLDYFKAHINPCNPNEVGGALVGKYTKMVMEMILWAKLLGSPCFVEGTLISTPDGYKEIQDIKVGDIVYSYDFESEQIVEHQVTRTFKNQTESIVEVTIEDETIRCTTEHPFYVVDKGWTGACDLESGDELQTQNGKVVVDSVKIIFVEKDVYNLEIENVHNYFVSEKQVLCHNACKLPGEGKGWTKLKGGQGWKDEFGNIWKKDMKHKNHWDVSDRKNKKIFEVDFYGEEIWPNGPKNRNKKP